MALLEDILASGSIVDYKKSGTTSQAQLMTRAEVESLVGSSTQSICKMNILSSSSPLVGFSTSYKRIAEYDNKPISIGGISGNLSTGEITVNETSSYSIDFTGVSNIDSQIFSYTAIYVNNSFVEYASVGIPTNVGSSYDWVDFSFSNVISLNANDTVSVYLSAGSASSNGTFVRLSFSVSKI